MSASPSARWTEAQDAELRRPYAKGLSFSDIAKSLGGNLSRNAVIGRASRVGVTSYVAWTPEREDRLCELHATGASYAVMAVALGTSRSSVAKRCRKLNLPLRDVSESMFRHHAKTRNAGLTRNLNRKRSELSELSELRRPKRLPQEPVAPPDCVSVKLIDLEWSHCRWPMGEICGPETLFCGAPKERRPAEEGRPATTFSYCRYHQQISTGQGTYSEQRAVHDAEKAA